MNLPISGFIIAKNEAHRITRAIKSLQNLVNEIVVVDSGSTDDTVKICESLGVIVIHHPFENYVKQKIFAESKCSNQWVINLDADEELSEELQQEIKNLFKHSEPSVKAYTMKVIQVSRKDNKKRLFAPYNSCLRLYHRGFASFAFGDQESYYTDNVFLKDKNNAISLLKAPIWHCSIVSPRQALEKINFYTDMQLADAKRKPIRFSNIRLILEFPFSFIKAFILRKYFVFGMSGFIDSMLYAFSRFIRLAKIYEEQSKQNNKL
jgi:glycosyltransferase involved in cell wall biosynthesis